MQNLSKEKQDKILHSKKVSANLVGKATTHCSDWGTEQIISWLTLLYLFLENIA